MCELFGRMLYCDELFRVLYIWFVHVDNWCDQVSSSLLRCIAQFKFGYVSGQTMFMRWLPMCCAYRNFSASDMLGAFQKWLDSF